MTRKQILALAINAIVIDVKGNTPLPNPFARNRGFIGLILFPNENADAFS